ncbi:VOC family protein [Bacillus toyonensis]|uniref:VOC family protein n=1 Tax=Bacillus toyonensis TaxID=155322 RepID=UPI002E22F6BD|nr:VOC family protein [Bacillus toyonensis]
METIQGGKSLFSRIGELHLPANNIDETIEWYQNKLGFKLKMPKFKDDLGYVAVLTPAEGEAVLLLVETNDNTTANFLRDGRKYQTFALYCPDLEYTHKSLKNAGVEVTEIYSRGEGARYFIFTDPSGNYVEAAWSKWD